MTIIMIPKKDRAAGSSPSTKGPEISMKIGVKESIGRDIERSETLSAFMQMTIDMVRVKTVMNKAGKKRELMSGIPAINNAINDGGMANAKSDQVAV